MKNIDAIMQESGFVHTEHKTGYWYAKEGNEKILVELRHGLRAVRDVRAMLLSLATQAVKDASEHAYIILLDPQLSLARLEEEWRDATAVLKDDVQARMGLVVIAREITSFGLSYRDSSLLVSVLPLFGDSTEPGRRSTKERQDTFFMVLKILINRWLLGERAMTTSQLMDMTGCSYPTVAKALQRLGNFIHRHSDRRIELKRFPQKDWEELLLTSERVRRTVRFVDRSGKPRSPDALLQRLYRLNPEGVAVGGVHGASYWHPSLNLHGTPRLDLSIHALSRGTDLSFVERLDPALESTHEPRSSASLAIHFVYRKVPLFYTEHELAVPWADPVECLLDLYELRLVEQAQDMIETLVNKEKK